jgi:hypothetical protein
MGGETKEVNAAISSEQITDLASALKKVNEAKKTLDSTTVGPTNAYLTAQNKL